MSRKQYYDCRELINEIRIRPALWNKEDEDHSCRYVVEKLWLEVSEKMGISVKISKKKWKNLRDTYRREYWKQTENRKTNPKAKIVKSRWIYFSILSFLQDHLYQRRKETDGQIILEDQVMSDKQMSEKQSVIRPKIESEESNDSYFGDNNVPKETCSAEPIENYFNESEHITNDNSDYEKLNEIATSTKTDVRSLLQSFQEDIIKLEKDKLAMMSHTQDDDDALFFQSLLPYIKSLESSKKFILRTKIQQFVCDFLYSEQNTYPNNIDREANFK